MAKQHDDAWEPLSALLDEWERLEAQTHSHNPFKAGPARLRLEAFEESHRDRLAAALRSAIAVMSLLAESSCHDCGREEEPVCQHDYARAWLARQEEGETP